MKFKNLCYYSLSAFLFMLCFITSTQTIVSNDPGINFEPSVNTALNALIAIIFVAFSLSQFRFRSWFKPLSLFAWGGLFIGTIGIMNILLIDPMAKGGSFWPWIFSLVILFYFRNIFLPFQLGGFRLTGNLAIGAGIFLFFKILVMSGALNGIPLVGPYLSISESHIGFYDLAIMSLLWTVGIILYYIGICLLSTTINDENEEQLSIIKENLMLDAIQLKVFGIRNIELLGRSKTEVEDIFINKAIEMENKYLKSRKFLNMIEAKRNESQLISNISGLLEHKSETTKNQGQEPSTID